MNGPSSNKIDGKIKINKVNIAQQNEYFFSSETWPILNKNRANGKRLQTLQWAEKNSPKTTDFDPSAIARITARIKLPRGNDEADNHSLWGSWVENFSDGLPVLLILEGGELVGLVAGDRRPVGRQDAGLHDVRNENLAC